MPDQDKRKGELEHQKGPAQPQGTDRPEPGARGLAKEAEENEVEQAKARKNAAVDNGNYSPSKTQSPPD